MRSTAIQDVFFVHDSLKLATSAYMELPQGAYVFEAVNWFFPADAFFSSYECLVASTGHKKLHEQSIHLYLGGVYTLVIREYGGKIKVNKSHAHFKLLLCCFDS